MSRRDMPNLTQANTTLSARDAAWRRQQRQKELTAGRSFYNNFRQDTESYYVYLCSLLVEAALELNPALRVAYIEAVTALSRCDTREIESNIATHLIDKESFLKTRTSTEFESYLTTINRFIVAAFNYDRKQPERTLENSPFLAVAVAISTKLNSKNVTCAELDSLRMGDDYWVMQDKTDDITNRPDKQRRHRLAVAAKQLGLHITHEDGLYKLAKLWYVAYPVLNNLTAASGMGDYHEVSLPVFNNPGTAHHKLEPFTNAVKNIT